MCLAHSWNDPALVSCFKAHKSTELCTNARQSAPDKKRNKTKKKKKICLRNKNPCLEQVHKNLWIVQNGDLCSTPIFLLNGFVMHVNNVFI